MFSGDEFIGHQEFGGRRVRIKVKSGSFRPGRFDSIRKDLTKRNESDILKRETNKNKENQNESI